ncbi:MAG TPA: replication initiator protein A [Candidatus Coprocola pullicola]|nr:replication initiator protein A [Candidatus Coprocola pullicola]
MKNYGFYKIPKPLFAKKKYHTVSIHAKMLYELLLDRMHLSFKNS